jgi:hypothetical protein
VPNDPIMNDKKPTGSAIEQIIGLLPLIAIGGALFYWWGRIVPFVLLALEDTLHAVIVGIVLVSILFMLFDAKLRTLVFYMYRMLLRWLTGLVIDRNPISILKTYLERFRDQQKELNEGLGEVRAQRGAMIRKVSENEAKIKICLSRADAFEKHGDKGMLAVESRQHERLTQRLANQKQSVSRLEFIINVLDRYRQICDEEVADISNEIDVRIDEQKEGMAFRKAMRAAKNILKGLPEKEMYDDSVAVLEDRYNRAIGEIEQMMTVTNDVVKNADVDDEAALALMTSKLNEWRNRDSGLSLGKTSKGEIINTSQSLSGEKVPVAVRPDSDWNKLFS